MVCHADPGHRWTGGPIVRGGRSNKGKEGMNGARSMKRGALLQLAGWLALTAAFAALGAFASVHAAVFYAQLDRPGWAPPAWLFGPVWSLLYLMMAIAAWRVGRAAAPGDRCIAEIHLPAERHEEKRRAALPLLSLRRLPQARNGM